MLLHHQVTEEEASKLKALLSAEELQSVAQAQTADVWKERLLARAFARCTLARYLRHTQPRQVMQDNFRHTSSDTAAYAYIAGTLGARGLWRQRIESGVVSSCCAVVATNQAQGIRPHADLTPDCGGNDLNLPPACQFSVLQLLLPPYVDSDADASYSAPTVEV